MPQIHFNLKYASGIEDTDTVSSNDLYGVITYGGQKAKTEVAKDGLFQGFKFAWNATFGFDATDDNDIEVRLYDKDVGFDDYIGRAVFSITGARNSGEVEIDAPVQNKQHEEKGFVKAVIRYTA